jgi:NAD(P)-dependent dehydrogenase (short-subunit alcohol dehydrogenase family)
MAVNVRGTWLMSTLTIPHMLERGAGAIINNCSVLGLKACAGAAAYNTSKGAVAQLTRSMALELAGTGVRVNAICPATTLTPMVTDVFAAAPDPAAAEAAFLSLLPVGRFGSAGTTRPRAALADGHATDALRASLALAAGNGLELLQPSLCLGPAVWLVHNCSVVAVVA